MTEPLFFDTDCISAFLWVDNESILSKLFPGRIVTPKEVYDELSHPGVNRVKGLKAQVDLMIKAGNATIETITVGTDTYELYRKLTSHPDPGKKIIGRGEAASISLAKEKQGILASNNLRDIFVYVKEYDLLHLTTGDIMKMALDAGYINESQGNTIWGNMIARKKNLDMHHFRIILQTISWKNYNRYIPIVRIFTAYALRGRYSIYGNRLFLVDGYLFIYRRDSGNCRKMLTIRILKRFLCLKEEGECASLFLRKMSYSLWFI